MINRYCCKNIEMDSYLKEELSWACINSNSAEGVIYMGPNSMRYSYPEEGVSVRELRECIARYDAWVERHQRDYVTMYPMRAKKKVKDERESI